MKCPECERDIKDSKLAAHGRRIHGILYAASEETYRNVIQLLRDPSFENELMKCPECDILKTSLKALGNHYYSVHAGDIVIKNQRKRSKNKKRRSGLHSGLKPKKRNAGPPTKEQKAIRDRIDRKGFDEGAKAPGSIIRKVTK